MFSIQGEWTWANILPFESFKLDFGASLVMLGLLTFVGLGMTNEDFEPCTYQIQTLMGIFEKACGFTKD
jgi:hypothetical protein